MSVSVYLFEYLPKYTTLSRLKETRTSFVNKSNKVGDEQGKRESKEKAELNGCIIKRPKLSQLKDFSIVLNCLCYEFGRSIGTKGDFSGLLS